MTKIIPISLLLLSIITLSSCNADSENSKLSNNAEPPNGHVHSFENRWSYDSIYHWHRATCGHDVVADKTAHIFNDVVTPATYDHGGYTTHTCIVCGYSYADSETDLVVHHYSEAWSHSETNHWHACTDTGYENLKSGEAAHTFNDVVTPATYDHGGYTTHTCTICGYSYVDNYTSVLKRKIPLSTDNYNQYLKCFIDVLRGSYQKDPWLGTKNAYYGISIYFNVRNLVDEYYKYEDVTITFSYEVSTFVYESTVNPTKYTNKKMYQWRRGTETVSIPISGKYQQSWSFDDVYHNYDNYSMTIDSISGYAVEK